MSKDDLASLVESIKTSGLIHPIVLGKWEEDGDTVEGIVDGRNRLAACKIAGVEPRFTKLNGEDVKSFIAAENLERRNMNASQKAMAPAMIFPEPEEAKVGPRLGWRGGALSRRREFAADFQKVCLTEERN
jgi:ParB-like chromosome segregation protein Spo0J